MDKKILRRIGVAVGVVVALIVILGGVWLWFTRRSFPQTSGTLKVDGLTASVEIYRDSYGVPHIYAENSHDLFFAEGYVHAQDRFWQMEFWRRIGSGRLSEYFGKSTLSTDIYLRTVGFARVAEQEYAEADPAAKALLDAYADGVNAYILTREPEQLGLEFALLKLQGVDVQIEPWTPVNTLTWAKVMAQDLSGNMSDELARIDLIRAVGLHMVDDYIPAYREGMPYIVPDAELEKLGLLGPRAVVPPGDDPSYLADLNTHLVGGFDPGQALAFGRGEGLGSNNWVVSGKLTTTGKPLLANDPHLGIQMPSIWYEIGLHCVEKTPDCPYELRGYSFAGVPGIIIGHNDRIAWGMTNVGPDVQDLYIERINPENPNQYEVDGVWMDMQIVPEEIEIQGQDDPYVLLVRNTRHGPIITDHGGNTRRNGFNIGPEGLPADLELTALSLRWTALQPSETFVAILELDAAQNYDDFRAALNHFAVPSQNFIYADVDGNIGYQTPGLIPIRARGDGTLPVPGWTDEYEWTGFIPYDELPRAYNPDQGYIVTANNPVVSPNYPYMISSEFDHGYRAKRIVELITGDPDGISIDDMAAIQGDDLSLSALEVIPYLKDLSFDDASVGAARDRLLDWDGQMRMDSPEAALYAYFWVALLDKTFHDQLPDSLWPDGGGRNQDAIYHLLGDPQNPWWNDITTSGTVETRDDILKAAFEKGYKDGVDALGDNLDQWRWGAIHTSTFRNQTLGISGIGLIEAIFNRGPVATNGGSAAVNNTGWDATDPFGVTLVPSMRQIIDLGNLSNSRMIHTTGESGHPYNRHYNDFIDLWRLIQYHPTFWERADVEANSREHLTLTPGG